MSEFEKTLRFGRKDKKLTQREMAEMSGISPGDIARLESGVYVSLDKEALNRISSVIGMDAGIFAALYHSEFQQELRKNRTDRPNPDNTEPPLPPELMDIIESVMTLPAGTKDYLIRTIQVLVQSFKAA